MAASSGTGSADTPTNDPERLLFDNFYSVAAGPSDVSDWTVDLTGLDNDLTRLILYAPSNTTVSTGLIPANGTGGTLSPSGTTLRQYVQQCRLGRHANIPGSHST